MADSPRTLTAFFDRREDAQEACDRLQRLSLPQTSVRLTGGEEYSGRSDYVEDRGFWASLSDLFFPDEDRAAYSEGLRRGGFLVTVNMIPAGMYDDVLDILDDEGAVDVDQRAETWRAEGWTGSGAAGSAGTSAGMTGTTAGGIAGATEPSAGMMGGTASGTSDTAGGMAGTTSGGMSDMAARSAATDEEVLPVVEEELRIGKRDVNLGRVRVRSYVVEEPVSEQLNLRGERVEVERRPVDRPVGATDAAFTDRTIEAEEHIEEPVVSKEARIKEEIALRRQAEEHTEQVSDTVRHTEVEVEDERDRGPLGGAGNTAKR